MIWNVMNDTETWADFFCSEDLLEKNNIQLNY